jgi:hypothetical protein
MAVVTVIDHGVKPHVHPDVISVVDSDLGRITIQLQHRTGRHTVDEHLAHLPEALRQDLANLLKAAKVPV